MSSVQGLPQQTMPDDGDVINLFDLLDIVLDSRWLIAGITALALTIGVGYALLSTPIYQADTLIQVEDTKVGGANGLLGDMSGMFDIKSPAVAEIEILRSRLMVGQAVANLHDNIQCKNLNYKMFSHFSSLELHYLRQHR